MEKIDKIVKHFLGLINDEVRNRFYIHEVVEKSRMKEFHNEIKKQLAFKDKLKQRYFYLITFTLNDENKDSDPKVIEKYIISRLQGSALQIEKAHLVQELTQQGRPHWHASIIAKKYISKDRFKYYVNKFGYIDISKNHSQNYDTMLKYITKSNIVKNIVGGL